jgi:hypothetical protein
MIVVISIAATFTILFGILALPYNAVISIASWAVALAALLYAFVRQPEKRLRVVGGTVIGCVLGIMVWNVVLMTWVNQEVVREMTTLNPNGTAGTALVVYHPGRSDLQERAINGFVEGLTEQGWRVYLTTASNQAPTDLSAVSLLVVGAQSYTWVPARPVQDYLRRVGDLKRLPVVAILSGLGETGPANAAMGDLVREVNGTMLSIYNVWQLRPIDELYGTDDAFAAMRKVAQDMTLTR